MFNNIGGKIKALAKIVCWLGIIASVLSGIILIAAGGTQNIVTGIVTIVVGALSSWIGSFLVYGFGELIDNTAALKENKQ